MPDPQNNPTRNLATNGRRVRHIRRSIEVRVFRSDEASESTLKFAKDALSGEQPGDHPSVSMVIRRALRLYRGHLSNALHTPLGLKAEYAAIREGTIMPTIAPREDAPEPGRGK